MSEAELQIFLPPRSEDPLSDMLRIITQAIEEKKGEVDGYGLGGMHGYGSAWDSNVFTMRRFYWGDCDCGADERSDKWYAAHPHARDCFRSERDRRWNAYDEKIRWDEIEAMAFPRGNDFFAGFDTEVERDGPFTMIVSRPRKDAAMRAWRAAYDKRQKEQARIVAELYDEFGLPRAPYQWRCTCGVDEEAKAYFATEGHYPTCSLELPNFRHHATGFEVRWYKYIGRDNETVNQPADLTPIFNDCLRDIRDSDPKDGDAKQGSARE